jgi:hypothetical protein
MNPITFGAYAANDEFKISVESNVVKYYRNDIWVYSSAVSPTLPLLVDVSINSSAGTVTNARVVNNSNAGFFTVTATNVGPSPIYQWKLNGGNAGTNSPNYTNISIVPGDVISVNITPDLGGCATTNYASNTITINGPGATTTWTGGTSTAWFTTSNWSNGVPNRFKAVTIPSGTTFSPSISSEANVYDITVANGATLTITASNQLYVYRNFTNNGTFVRNTSRVHFVGCSSGSQIDCANSQTFHNVTVNTAFPVNIASGTTQVAGNFAFTSGIVNQNASLQFLAGSSATGASNSSYVDGMVRKIGNTAFTFPVGDNGFYRPIAISAPSNVAHFFDAQYFNTDHNLGTPANWDPSFWTVTGCEYWNLTRNGGTASNVSVTLSWNEAACNPGYVTTPLDLRVTQWNGTTWTNQGNSGITGTATAGTLTSGAAVTTYGSFTLASATALNPLPVELLYFKGDLTESNDVLLEWKTTTEVNNDFFTVERSFNGIDFGYIGKVPGSGTTNTARTYTFQDDANNFSGNIYYRLKQTDVDGTTKILGIVRLYMYADGDRFTIYPNSVTDKQLNVVGRFGNQNNAQLVDLMGNVLKTFTWTNRANHVTLTLPELPNGAYLLRIQTSEGLTDVKRVVINQQ